MQRGKNEMNYAKKQKENSVIIIQSITTVSKRKRGVGLYSILATAMNSEDFSSLSTCESAQCH